MPDQQLEKVALRVLEQRGTPRTASNLSAAKEILLANPELMAEVTRAETQGPRKQDFARAPSPAALSDVFDQVLEEATSGVSSQSTGSSSSSGRIIPAQGNGQGPGIASGVPDGPGNVGADLVEAIAPTQGVPAPVQAVTQGLPPDFDATAQEAAQSEFPGPTPPGIPSILIPAVAGAAAATGTAVQPARGAATLDPRSVEDAIDAEFRDVTPGKVEQDIFKQLDASIDDDIGALTGDTQRTLPAPEDQPRVPRRGPGVSGTGQPFMHVVEAGRPAVAIDIGDRNINVTDLGEAWDTTNGVIVRDESVLVRIREYLKGIGLGDLAAIIRAAR